MTGGIRLPGVLHKGVSHEGVGGNVGQKREVLCNIKHVWCENRSIGKERAVVDTLGKQRVTRETQ